ncbi:MAG: alpha-1,2-fucosyltransferase [Lachnospiraceae bacterium]|nr:alpha-1,2-fucosyltransferase [Lachnospiraceae bacterium]
MIVQQFNSGLGNQMFQYVFFRLLKKHHPELRIKADLTWFSWNDVHQGYELKKIFGIVLPEADPWEIAITSGQFPHTIRGYRYINRVLRIFDSEYIDRHCIDEMSYKEMTGYDGSEHAYLTGFYISEQYYKEDLDEIRQVFSFPEDELESSTVMRHNIESVEAVSIHVRRGDYLDPVYKDRFDLLGEDYYRAAVERMRQIYEDPHFFIFSDDKDFVNIAFEWIPASERTVVTGNTGADSWKDMYLMSICKGNILANSTFSTWGALLNKNTQPHVIYPKAYIAGTDSEIKTIKGWERL